jgi:hypothetical protein
MAYIFLDESGDLGLDLNKSGVSAHFIVTALFSDNPRRVQKCVKKVRQSLSEKFTGALHACKDKPLTRRRLLHALVETDCSAMVIVLKKRKVYTDLKNEKGVLYNIIANILLDRIFSKKLLGDISRVTIVASRKETNQFLNENFSEYIRSSLSKKHGLDINVLIKTPHEEHALQAVDYVSWAIFRKYEKGDDDYYKIIRGLIEEENDLY